VLAEYWGARPPDPQGFIALVLKASGPLAAGGRARGGGKAAPHLLPAPGTALGLLPSRALSSAQAESHFTAREAFGKDQLSTQIRVSLMTYNTLSHSEKRRR
jgi:hypothetical protein